MFSPTGPFRREDLQRVFTSEAFRKSGLTRRQFVARGGLLALALGAVGPFLAACGGSESPSSGSDSPTSTASSGSASAPSSPTTGAGAATPTTASPDAEDLPAITSIPESLKGSGEVRIATAGGALAEAERKAFFEPFMELSGIKVVEVEGFSTAQVKTQVDSKSVQWDIVGFEYSNVLNLLKQGDYFEPIDYDLVDTTNVPDTQVHEFSVGYLQVATVMTYRTDAFDQVPASYADFWDLEAFPGPRNWMSGAMGISPFLEGALLADGVPMDELYPLDIERAFASLTKIRDDIVKFWESGAQSAQLMADRETVLGVAWNGRITPLEQEGLPVAIQWNQAMLQVDNLAIPKGAQNVENAQKLIAFMMLPVPQARMSMLMPYGFTNEKAAEYISPEQLKRLPSSPEYADRVFYYSSDWWSENLAKAIEAWNEWALS